METTICFFWWLLLARQKWLAGRPPNLYYYMTICSFNGIYGAHTRAVQFYPQKVAVEHISNAIFIITNCEYENKHWHSCKIKVISMSWTWYHTEATNKHITQCQTYCSFVDWKIKSFCHTSQTCIHCQDRTCFIRMSGWATVRKTVSPEDKAGGRLKWG